MIHGIRVEGKQKLKRIVDHLESKPQTSAVLEKKQQVMWKTVSGDHSWDKLLRKHDASVVKLLLRLAIDVYNDSLSETLPAWNWPSRSLAQLKADEVVESVSDEGWNVELQNFIPPPSMLQYRDQNSYKDMLEVIASIESKKLRDKVGSSICYSIQIDGSLDIISATDKAHLPFDNIVGITTDGESANTGSRGGLWKLLQDKLNRKIITVWCTCHRSDLAMKK